MLIKTCNNAVINKINIKPIYQSFVENVIKFNHLFRSGSSGGRGGGGSGPSSLPPTPVSDWPPESQSESSRRRIESEIGRDLVRERRTRSEIQSLCTTTTSTTSSTLPTPTPTPTPTSGVRPSQKPALPLKISVANRGAAPATEGSAPKGARPIPTGNVLERKKMEIVYKFWNKPWLGVFNFLSGTCM